jgi:type I pantothenate kinase
MRTEVVATDGFLLPNAELAARGLSMQKGFPSSYDLALIAAFLEDLRAGRSASVPVYSHAVYDRVPDQVRTVDPGAWDVVVVEGVNALQPEIARHADLTVYLDADEALVRSWFVDRLLEQIRAATDDDGRGAGGGRQEQGSFYRPFATLTSDAQREFAEGAWTGINLVNLTEHIAATVAEADLVVDKTEGHAATVRPGPRRGRGGPPDQPA